MKKHIAIFLSLLISSFLFAEQPIVKDIKAQAGKGTKINIIWSLPSKPDKKITKLRVYRSLKQISSYAQIEKLKPIAEVDASYTGYTDTVTDFNDYFYAVVAVTDKPYDLILLSFNSTVSGVHLIPKAQPSQKKKTETEKIYPDGTLRETPLPFVDFEDITNKEDLISDESLASAQALLALSNNTDQALKPYIFEEDMISPDAGDDYLLFEILKTTFVQRKYKEALTQLNKLVGTNINENTRNRAYFYIGEAEYLSGDYEAAVKTFVKIKQIYPVQAKKWLDSALNKL